MDFDKNDSHSPGLGTRIGQLQRSATLTQWIETGTMFFSISSSDNCLPTLLSIVNRFCVGTTAMLFILQSGVD